MSAAEFAFWFEYRKRHGFKVDRLEWVTAQSGAYVGHTMGGEAQPLDLIFSGQTAERRTDPRLLAAYLTSMPNVKVRTYARR
jgi:hypothetical protein